MSIKLGQTDKDTKTIGLRDAFHVPCVLVSSEYRLNPGVPIRFQDGSCSRVIPCDKSISQGVVDPFLPLKFVGSGTSFWMLLNPGMVEDLVHSFNIKGVPNPEEVHAREMQEEYERIKKEEEELNDGCRGCQN